MEYILEAGSITKKFPGVVANDNVNLNVKAGEILGLIGENGAGKSTLLKVLNGIYPYGTYTGTLVLAGKEIRPENTQDAMAEGIGYVPQEINVLKNFNVAENIYMSDLRLNRLKAADKKSKSVFVNFSALYKTTEAFLKDNKISLDPKADVRKLSIGQQQMLMIARALATNPKVLILDEPTTSLSSGDVQRLFEVVRGLKEKGVGIIFVTHKLSEILELTDRVTILRDGKNISTFERAKYDSGRIIADMIGREIKNMYPQRESKIGQEVLRVENLTVDHPYIANTNLIENVSFTVHEGEVLGLAGLVGAGRSEVCMAIYGLGPSKSGKIFLKGKEIKVRKTSHAVKQKIGMISEDRKRFGLNFVWDVKHNIAISNLDTLVKGPFVSPSEMVKRVTPYYNKLRIKAPSLNTKVTTLSGGNQQKVVIARSLNTLPELIILDEPTKGIDVGSKNEIYQLINDLASQNVAVIMISSELPELMAMCDRFVVMAEGRVSGELSKSEATEAKIMEKSVVSFKTGQKEAING
ncbi:MAG: sugar ABC transporter ATP-binding protein [Treponema sp.]|jgi:D-xylose transport system ATP-binding protein|nr:sugar ABC transporter ATP-binding protein [Treponema sp.]